MWRFETDSHTLTRLNIPTTHCDISMWLVRRRPPPHFSNIYNLFFIPTNYYFFLKLLLHFIGKFSLNVHVIRLHENEYFYT